MSQIERYGASQTEIQLNVSPMPASFRSVLGRRWKRITLVFLVMAAATAAVTFVSGDNYESEFKVLVNRERPDVTATADLSAAGRTPDNVTEEEMNSEAALIKSRDILSKLVTLNNLDAPPEHVWGVWLEKLQGDSPAQRYERAIRHLAAALHVEPVRKSNIIDVTYSSKSPELSAKVLQGLVNLYMAKHLAVHQTPGAHEFFDQQVQQYDSELRTAENALVQFGRDKSTGAPQVERDLVLQKLADLRVQRAQSAAAVDSALARRASLQNELEKTPARLVTQMKSADNAHLLGDLKSTLLTLQLKRTDLATKYDPSYPAVRELDEQIAQTKATIDAETAKPVLDNSTDQNPTYQWVSAELAKLDAELPALRVQATAATAAAARTEAQVLQLNDDNIVQQSLLRDAKLAEDNYALYVQKREQARIADELNRRRVSNVVITEQPVPSPLPVRSQATTIAMGLLLCLLLSSASGFAADYMDPKFRTLREVESVLETPVLAAIPFESGKGLDLGTFATPEISRAISAGD